MSYFQKRRNNMKKRFKFLPKLLVFMFLAIGVFFTTAPKTNGADIDYSAPFLFAYNDHVYIIISSDNTGAAPLVGMTINTFDTEFYMGWDGATLTASDYTEVTGSAKDSVFVGSYGSISGLTFTDYYRLFELHGGGNLFPLNTVADVCILQMFLKPQYLVIAKGGVFESMTLKQFFDLQELGYYNGFITGYEVGEIDGIASGYVDGLADGVADKDVEIAQAYDDGYDAGILVVEEDAYHEGYAAGIAHEANGFYDDIETWLVPAIIIVMFAGGVFSIIAMKRRSEE